MEAGSMEKMSNREMKKTVKIEKQLKKATSRKNKNSSGPIKIFKDKAAIYLKKNLFKSIFHRLALKQCNIELEKLPFKYILASS